MRASKLVPFETQISDFEFVISEGEGVEGPYHAINGCCKNEAASDSKAELRKGQIETNRGERNESNKEGSFNVV
jgi:hypothetical protein